eukprot:646975-Alexandrium_andersonii.AAC.1
MNDGSAPAGPQGETSVSWAWNQLEPGTLTFWSGLLSVLAKGAFEPHLLLLLTVGWARQAVSGRESTTISRGRP